MGTLKKKGVTFEKDDKPAADFIASLDKPAAKMITKQYTPEEYCVFCEKRFLKKPFLNLQCYLNHCLHRSRVVGKDS